MPFVTDSAHLKRAARTCMRARSAPGADGLSWAGFRRGLPARLEELGRQLRTGQWQPQPMRVVDITTYTGKVVPAAIPTVTDRVVHRAMRTAIEPILEQNVLADWVSCYRPARNRITALRQANQHLTAGLCWAADIDVHHASEGGSTQELVQWLAQHVSDGPFLRLFSRVIDSFPSPLISGTGLWPVLFHLRLAQADAQLADLPVIRFADNYLVFAATRPQAQQAMYRVEAALASIDLRANTRKSKIRAPHQNNAEDLFLLDG